PVDRRPERREGEVLALPVRPHPAALPVRAGIVNRVALLRHSGGEPHRPASAGHTHHIGLSGSSGAYSTPGNCWAITSHPRRKSKTTDTCSGDMFFTTRGMPFSPQNSRSFPFWPSSRPLIFAVRASWRALGWGGEAWGSGPLTATFLRWVGCAMAAPPSPR